METLSCLVCGGNDLKKQADGTYVCAHCNTRFYESALHADEQALMSAVGDALYEKECENVAKLRSNLWGLVHAEYVDSVKITCLCRDIQKIMPGDFLAEFYELACENGYIHLTDFLNGIDVEKNYMYIDEVLGFAIKLLKPETLLAVSNLIIRAYENRDIVKFSEWNERFSETAKKVEDGIFDVTLSRDVFVAYKSEDMAKVNELVSYLENVEGLACFVAARNLQHGKIGDYDKKLEQAMDSCKVIVFVSSKMSRKVGDAKTKELPYIKKQDMARAPAEYRAQNNYIGLPKKYKKPRVEYVIEEYTHAAAEKFIAEFFDGYERQTKVQDVAARIFEQLEAGDIDEKTEKYNAGEVCYKAGDYEAAYAYFKEAAELGHPDAQLRLGDMHVSGKGAGQNDEEAVKWYKKAALAGIEIAKSRLDKVRRAMEEKIENERKKAEKERQERERRERERKAEEERLEREREERERKAEEERRERERRENERRARERKAEEERAMRIYRQEQAAERKQEKREKRQMIMSGVSAVLKKAAVVFTIILAVFGVAAGLFSYIFPMNYTLIYENYHSIFYGITIAGLVADGVAMVLSLMLFYVYNKDRHEKDQYCLDSYGYISSIMEPLIIFAIMILSGLAALLSGSFTDTMFGWGIAFVVVGGILTVAQIGISIQYACNEYFEFLLHIPMIACCYFAIMAIGGIAYAETLQPHTEYDEVTGIYYSVRDDNTLTAYLNDYGDGDVIVPEYVNGLRVTAVGRPRYAANNSKLKSVSLPAALMTIECNAFDGCSALTEISYYTEDGQTAVGFPKDLMTIGESAFFGCSALKTVDLTANITTIGESAFENCTMLESITIPGGVTEVKEAAFRGCSKLSTVTFKEGVTTIGENAFKNCTRLDTVNMASTVSTLNENAFANCRMLKTLYLYKGIAAVAEDCFSGCSALTIYCGLPSYPDYSWYQEDKHTGLENRKVKWGYTPEQYAEEVKKAELG